MVKVVVCILVLSFSCTLHGYTAPSGPGPAAQGPAGPSGPGRAGAGPPSGAGFTSPGPPNPSVATFNLTTYQSVMNFLSKEGIAPSMLITSNCINAGSPCSPGGKQCCLSPVFSCQGSPGVCNVSSAHTSHIPQLKQVVQALNSSYTTENPVM